MDCTIRVAKTKALISFAVTAKLICVFVFPYAKIRFSHDAAQFAPGMVLHSQSSTIDDTFLLQKQFFELTEFSKWLPHGLIRTFASTVPLLPKSLISSL